MLNFLKTSTPRPAEIVTLGGGVAEIVRDDKIKVIYLYIRGATDESEYESLKAHLNTQGYFLQPLFVAETK
jgi:hypothetical protein